MSKFENMLEVWEKSPYDCPKNLTDSVYFVGNLLELAILVGEDVFGEEVDIETVFKIYDRIREHKLYLDDMDQNKSDLE